MLRKTKISSTIFTFERLKLLKEKESQPASLISIIKLLLILILILKEKVLLIQREKSVSMMNALLINLNTHKSPQKYM